MNFLKLLFPEERDDRQREMRRLGPILCSLVLCSIVMLSSCVTKRVEVAHYEGSLEDRLKGLQDINSIRAEFSIEFDRGNGVTIRGEGLLTLSEDTLDLQIYSMGFLVAEVKADKSGISSNPSVNKSRLVMLVDGLRNSFFWWSIKGYEIRNEGEHYQLVNSWKRVKIDKKTMIPFKQVIDLDEGKQLDVYYYEPSNINGFDFPSKIRIELSNYSVNLWIKDLSVSMK